MPVFIYSIEQKGRLVSGEIRAQNLQIAEIKLKSRRIDPVYIKEKPLIPFFSGGGKIKQTIVLFFTRQMSFLLNSGVSLIQALEMCIVSNESKEFQQVLRRMLKQLEGGKSLSRCLRSRPDIFDGFYVNMIVCAEETGLLDQVLKDLANYMEKAEMIRARVKSAMMYPIIVLIIAFSIITGIIFFVIPKFEDLYSSTGGGLPALTQVLVNLSHFLRNNIVFFAVGLVTIPFAMYQYLKTEGGKRAGQSILKLFPVFRSIQYQAALVRFFRSFHSLLKAGVNFLEALDVAYNISGHPDIQRGIAMSRDFITKGKSFAKGLEISKAFPPLVYHMAKIGEESGKMEQTFDKLTEYYEERLNTLIAGMIKMIEPIMIVVLGGIVGIMILALYLPVFNMGSIIS